MLAVRDEETIEGGESLERDWRKRKKKSSRRMKSVEKKDPGVRGGGGLLKKGLGYLKVELRWTGGLKGSMLAPGKKERQGTSQKGGGIGNTGGKK